MIIFNSLIAFFILMGLIPYVRKAPVRIIKEMAIWIILFLLCIIIYYSHAPLVAHFEKSIVAPRASGEVKPEGNIVYARSEDGHFYIDATIDGNVIRFMVDTGASDVVLSLKDAEKLGYNMSELVFSQSYQTANGIVKGAPVIIKTMAIAGNTLVMRDIEGSVNSSLENISLLGMSFLEKVKGYQVTRHYLTLFP